MTLDHFGRPISYYLYQCFGFFSAAEGFFFLSGFVGLLAAASKSAKDPGQRWMFARAFKTWRYHIATLAALAIAGLAIMPQTATLFKSIYGHPVAGSFWSLTLVNTPEWLDVLPLYVIFLMLGPVAMPLFLKAKRKREVFALWLPSLAVWIAAQFGLRNLVNSAFPQWIHHGDFDPFAWQCVYFSGTAVAAWWKLARKDEAAGHPRTVALVRSLAPAIVIALVFCFLWSHQFIALPLPAEAFTSKVHVGPLRFANFFVFMLGICAIVRKWPNLLDFRPTNAMGRCSIDIYTAHIVFVYIWMNIPGSIRYHGPWNILVPVAACVLLWALAKIRLGRSSPSLKPS